MRICAKHVNFSIQFAYLATFILFLFVVLFYKLPLSTDDWYWGFMLKQGKSLPIFDDYFYRLPVCKTIFHLVFPLLLFHPFLGKLLVWGVGIIGLYLPLSWFFHKYDIKPVFLPFISFLAFFAPNQFELNYLLSSMPFCFGFLFSGLGFYLFRKGSKISGTLFYLLSFFTLESFIVLAIVIESSLYLETILKRSSLKKIIYALSPAIISYIVIRLGLHFIHSYDYGVEASLKASQIRGLIIQCFLIDFYKLNSILSSVQLLLFGYLLYVYLKDKQRIKKKNWIIALILMFLLLITTSSYYYFLEYSARRALAGQIAFCWGIYLLFIAAYLSKAKKSSLAKTLLFLVLISTQIANQIIIFRTKQFNRVQIRKNITMTKEQLSKKERNITIDLDEVASQFKRDWIFASAQDVEMMFKFYLSPEEFRCIRFTKGERE